MKRHPPSWVPGAWCARGPRGRLALATALALGILLSGCGTPDVPTRISPSGAATTPAQAGVPAVVWGAERQRAVVALLERQASAVLSKDPAAFLAAVATGPETARQANRYEGMNALGLSVLRLGGVRERVPPVPVAPDAAATWD
ncbi:MAG TPA: hypothetical protein VFT81_02845, partial [Dermatophilaceae bacterium]|nr:hypothetical protein [Dermatophilaceae bacterium]